MNQSIPSARMALSVSEFCSAYSIGRSTFYHLAKSKQIRPLKVGKRTVIAVSEAERWLASLQAR
ncbi:MAG: helix-turn-helix domain-containing protein [Pseudomonadota bacterium]